MENEQKALFEVIPEPPKQRDKNKRKWENAFQQWCNKSAEDGTNPLGICGYGSMCDYCEDNTYGRPCVRALNAMCRDKCLAIDYEVRNYEGVWNWGIRNGK